jgi:membrane-associated phospholipid phosphatase
MSATGLDKIDPPAGVLRRTLANLAAWLSLVGRPRRVKAARLLPETRRLAIGVLAAVVCVAAAMILLDGRGLTFARTLPPWIVDSFNEITDFGRSTWFLVPIAVLILLAGVLTSAAAGRIANLVVVSLVVRLEFLFLAIALPGLTVTIVKRLIGRVRPSDLGPFSYMPWSWRPEYASLPSGHGTTAFAAAMAIGALWPKARIPMWAFAVVIAVSRVVIQAHFASDVIAAAFVGAFGAILVRNWFAARRLGFTVDHQGTVRALPGPSLRRIKTVARRLFGQ